MDPDIAERISHDRPVRNHVPDGPHPPSSRAPDELSWDECLQLLGHGGVGRVGLSIAALPVIVPVNYVLDDAGVVFRSGAGSKLDAALDNAVVCFEVGHIGPGWQSSWSVLVTGRAHEVAEREVSDQARKVLVPWAASARDRYVAIPLDLVSGRQVGAVLVGR